MNAILCAPGTQKKRVRPIAALRSSVRVSAHFCEEFIFPLSNFRPPQPVDIVALRRACAVDAHLAACVRARAPPASQYEQMKLNLNLICAVEGMKSL